MIAFLRAQDLIRIRVDKWFYEGRTGAFTLHGDGRHELLPIKEVQEVEDAFIYDVHLEKPVPAGVCFYIYEQYGSRCTLQWCGDYVRSPAFDEAYAYAGDDLGPVYTPAATTFKVWAPLARRVMLFDHDTPAAHLMERGECGVWSLRLEQDCERLRYTYLVDNISVINEALDPYAIASTANGAHSVVVNPDAFQFQIDKSKLPLATGPHQLVTYELSVRDYTYQQGRSTFDAVVEHLDYIAGLGITNLQLLPVYDFATVNEEDRFSRYNWGYDPFNYNVLDGSFVENPNDPYARINGFGQLIHAANQRGIRVTMDVVYNHLYDAGASLYNQIVPGYFTRYHADGTPSNGSFCGNDFRSEGAMVRKFIVDSVRMYCRVYGVDGYRFDLMGDLDIETMNQVRQTLDPGVLVYGEGWNMPSALPEVDRACIENQAALPGIAHFNDRFRNAFKGASHGATGRGLLLGTAVPEPHLAELLMGSPHVFDDLSKSINYVECHDNHTLHDWLVHEHKITDPEEVRTICSLALATVLLSFGAPFIHAGQEFMRTKHGVENSYNAGDDINQFDWARAEAHQDLADFVRALIRYRLSHPIYALDSAALREQVEITVPAPNVAVIAATNLWVAFNFSEKSVTLKGVTANVTSNMAVTPGELKRGQVCFK